jgi:hypothetical protein
VPESDLNIACEGGGANFRRCGRGLKAFMYLQIAIFLSSVTDLRSLTRFPASIPPRRIPLHRAHVV